MNEIDRAVGIHVREWAAFAHSPHLHSVLDTSNAEFAAKETLGDLITRRDEEWLQQSAEEPNELARELLSCRTASDLRSRIDSHARLEASKQA